MGSQSKLWYEFAIAQVAAESYLDQSAPIEQILRDGNNNRRLVPEAQFRGAVRLTPGQAQAFVNRYQIVDHHPNDPSGFSATVLFDRQTQEYTVAFRSTEYSLQRDGGDFERDAKGADTEVKDYGFALAQIDSMERYFQNLSEGKDFDGVG